MFDPRHLLKRLNRLIESFVPDTWTQGGELLRRPAPKEMRRLLLSEAKTISSLLDRAFSGHGSLLKELIDDISRKPDTQLMESWDVFCQELLSVRRALYRLILARQSRSELLNEWNDWERHAHHSRDDKSLTRFERQEMLASELRLRGIDIPVAKSYNESQEMKDTSVVVSAPIEVVSEKPLPSEPVSLADDWEPLWLNQADHAADFWESVLCGIDSPQLTQGQALRLVRGFRLAQANQKQADKVRQIRRYRLSTFGA